MPTGKLPANRFFLDPPPDYLQRWAGLGSTQEEAKRPKMCCKKLTVFYLTKISNRMTHFAPLSWLLLTLLSGRHYYSPFNATWSHRSPNLEVIDLIIPVIQVIETPRGLELAALPNGEPPPIREASSPQQSPLLKPFLDGRMSSGLNYLPVTNVHQPQLHIHFFSNPRKCLPHHSRAASPEDNFTCA